MVVYCVICKKTRVPRYSEVSHRVFHKFPKDEAKRKLWMEVTGKSQISEESGVCSDHFVDENYYSYTPNATVKRLIPGTIPSRNLGGNCALKNGHSKERLGTRISSTAPLDLNRISSEIVKKETSQSNLKDANKESLHHLIPTINAIPNLTQSCSPEDTISDSKVHFVQPCSAESNASDVETGTTNSVITPDDTIQNESIEETSSFLPESIRPTHSVPHKQSSIDNSVLAVMPSCETSTETSKCNENETSAPRNATQNIMNLSCVNKSVASRSNIDSSVESPVHSKRQCEKPLKRLSNKLTRPREKVLLGRYNFTRQDFQSEESWNKFLEMSVYIKKKISGLQKQDSRERKKLVKFRAMVDSLKAANHHVVARYLQVERDSEF